MGVAVNTAKFQHFRHASYVLASSRLVSSASKQTVGLLAARSEKKKKEANNGWNPLVSSSDTSNPESAIVDSTQSSK